MEFLFLRISGFSPSKFSHKYAIGVVAVRSLSENRFDSLVTPFKQEISCRQAVRIIRFSVRTTFFSFSLYLPPWFLLHRPHQSKITSTSFFWIRFSVNLSHENGEVSRSKVPRYYWNHISDRVQRYDLKRCVSNCRDIVAKRWFPLVSIRPNLLVSLFLRMLTVGVGQKLSTCPLDSCHHYKIRFTRVSSLVYPCDFFFLHFHKSLQKTVRRTIAKFPLPSAPIFVLTLQLNVLSRRSFLYPTTVQLWLLTLTNYDQICCVIIFNGPL